MNLTPSYFSSAIVHWKIEGGTERVKTGTRYLTVKRDFLKASITGPGGPDQTGGSLSRHHNINVRHGLDEL